MIEILVVRDPDSENDIKVWVDGRPASYPAVRIVDVDAGAGWDIDDWRETERELVTDLRLSSQFRCAIECAYADPPGYRYINGWEEL